ncbi:cytochrome P450 [Aspergillus insuetus]
MNCLAPILAACENWIPSALLSEQGDLISQLCGSQQALVPSAGVQGDEAIEEFLRVVPDRRGKVKWLLRGRLPFAVHELHLKYGDIVWIAPNEIAYATHDAWNEIYGHRTGQVGIMKDPTFYHSMTSEAGDILSADRSRHGYLRKQLSHRFSEKAPRDQEHIVRSHIELFLCRIRDLGQNGGQYEDARKWYNFFTFDVTSHLVFGEPFGRLQSSHYHPWVTLISDSIRAGVWIRAAKSWPGLIPLVKRFLPGDLMRRFDENRRLARDTAASRKEIKDCRRALIIDKTNVGYAATGSFIADVNLSANAVGNSLSLFPATYVPLQPISALLARRVGVRYCISALLVTWGSICMRHAAIKNDNAVIALRLLLGAAESGYMPASFYMMSGMYLKYILGLRMGFSRALRRRSGGGRYWSSWKAFLNTQEREHAVWRMQRDLRHFASDGEDNGPVVMRDITDVLRDWKRMLTVVFNVLGVLPVNAFTTFLPLIVQGMGCDGIKASPMSVPPFPAGAVGLVCIVFSSRPQILPSRYVETGTS